MAGTELTPLGHVLTAAPSTYRQRVRREVFKGQDAKGAHRTGSEGAALAILGYAAVACAAYLFDTNLITGGLLGEQLLCCNERHNYVCFEHRVKAEHA